MADKKVMRLGSGKVYCALFSGTIPEDSVLEADTNKFGEVSGGATIEYAVDTYTGETDLGVVKKTIITKETAKLKFGIGTFNGNTLAKLSPTARITDDTTKKIRTTKIGGIANDDGLSYIWRFINDDETDGRCDVTVVGKNTAGFSVAFAKDKESVLNPEITAEPNDADGTLIIYREFEPTAAQSTSVNSGTTGVK